MEHDQRAPQRRDRRREFLRGDVFEKLPPDAEYATPELDLGLAHRIDFVAAISE